MFVQNNRAWIYSNLSAGGWIGNGLWRPYPSTEPTTIIGLSAAAHVTCRVRYTLKRACENVIMTNG